MWHAGLMGGGDDWYNVVLVTAPVGSEIEFDDGDEVVTAVGTGSQQAIAIHDPSSTYNITVSVNGYQETDTVTSTAVSGTVFIKEFKFAKITLTFDDDFRGLAVTLTDGTHVASPTPTLPATGNTADFYVPYYEVTYTFSATVSGIPYTSKGVYVDSLDDECTEILQVRPDGKTATPTDDIQKWLECAGINKPYTTLDEVLGDHESLQILMTDHNAVDYMVRSKSWIKQIEVPTLTGATSDAFASASYDTTFAPWKAFNNDASDRWTTPSGQATGAYVGYHFSEPICVRSIFYEQLESSSPNVSNLIDDTVYVEYSNDGTNYTPLAQTLAFDNDVLSKTEIINNDVSATYWRIRFTNGNYNNGQAFALISRLQFYAIPYADHGITQDETAMRYIGRRNYASDRLLGLDNPGLVPVMTDDTHPEGEVIYSSYLALQEWSFYPYFAFDKMYGVDNWNSRWVSTLNEAGYIGYKFTSPKCIKAVSILQDSKEAHTTYDVGDGLDVTLQYHDGTNWVDVQNIVDSSSNISEMKFYPINNEISATDWRIKFNSTNIHDRTTLEAYSIVTELQFYDKDDPVYIEWMDAVDNSEYFESVLNAKNPTMTSATTPEGEVIRSSIYNNNANYEAWRAIGDPSAGGWSPNSNDSVNNCYIGYKFASPKCIRKIKFTTNVQSGVSWNFAVQGSNTGNTNDWTTIGSGFAAYANGLVNKFNIDNDDEYLYYRILVIYFTGYGYINCVDVRNLNFYARVDVDETKVMLYGANQDSFYYKDASQQDVPLTTLSTTEKEISKSDLPLGEFKLYSSVAKNPDDLTADFCKTFKNDDNLIEVMMRPENALYWYGYHDPAELINITSYGTNDGQCVFYDGTQYATLKSANGTAHGRISIYDKPLKNKQNFWAKAINRTSANGTDKLRQRYVANSLSNIIYPAIRAAYGYNSNIYRRSCFLNSKSSFEPRIDGGLDFDDTIGVTTDYQMRAFWHAFPNPACNLFSAAKDIVYYTENGVDIVVAETDEFGGAIVDFSKIPAGVTLYSSVAKDPSDPNLTDPYSKTFSPVNGRFWLMPDNTLYWYGYMSDNLESVTEANGWTTGVSSRTLATPVYGVNKITINTSSTTYGGVSNKNPLTGNTTANFIITGQTPSDTRSGQLWFFTEKNYQRYSGSDVKTDPTGMKKYTISGTAPYIATYSASGQSIDVNAFWLE